mgnify:CR=1 FL=1
MWILQFFTLKNDLLFNSTEIQSIVCPHQTYGNGLETTIKYLLYINRYGIQLQQIQKYTF